MPIAPSSYWNDVHGAKGEDVYKDEEGLQTIRNLAVNMSFMIKSIKAGEETFGKPQIEYGTFTNFIR